MGGRKKEKEGGWVEGREPSKTRARRKMVVHPEDDQQATGLLVRH